VLVGAGGVGLGRAVVGTGVADGIICTVGVRVGVGTGVRVGTGVGAINVSVTVWGDTVCIETSLGADTSGFTW
jgi:hypothetical protein